MAPDLPLDEAALACPSFEILYHVARSYLPGALRLLRVPEDQIDDFVHNIVLAAHDGFTVRGVRLVPRGAHAEPLGVLKAWLSGIAFRQVRDHRRRASQRLEVACGDRTDLLASSIDDAPSAEQIAADVQRCRIVARVLDRLPRDRADALVMFVVLGMTAPEIALELGVNENTVKSRVARAHTDFLASARRLSPDEQRTLECSAFFLPLGLGSWWPIEDESWTSPPQATQGSGLGFVAGAMAALLLASGGALVARGRDAAVAPPAIVAVREPSPAETAAPPSASALPVVLVGAPRLATRPSTPSAPRGVATAAADDTLRRESRLIRAAQRALEEGAYGRALDALAAHEQRFPLGMLALDRESLAARTRAALASR